MTTLWWQGRVSKGQPVRGTTNVRVGNCPEEENPGEIRYPRHPTQLLMDVERGQQKSLGNLFHVS